ncbi:MAG TPA: type II toxin-antitoxin system PemK/MazF family toxin [Candidatus Limnocylindrales bacterium]|nr:type II toxin-antitoxin system PemK/MazF family toxin [Candidatus Limnocylindrales bacterium]
MITFWPNPGTVLLCDFRGYEEPEMTKRRPVVVVSPQLARPVVLIVPLSQTQPRSVHPIHVRLTRHYSFLGGGDVWAKCDLLAHAGRARLDRLHHDRRFVAGKVSRLDGSDLHAVRRGVLHALGIARVVPQIPPDADL